MKKILISFAALMAVASSSWAAETVDVHDQVNNAQAPVHQMQSSSEKTAVQGVGMNMMDMDEHARASMSHQMMNNSNSVGHQNMAEMHNKMMNDGMKTTTGTSKPFSKMNEHEKAALVHEQVNNGQSSVIHQQQAEAHRNMVATN